MVRQAKVVGWLLLLRTYHHHGNGGLEEEGDEAKLYSVLVRVMKITARNSFGYLRRY